MYQNLWHRVKVYSMLSCTGNMCLIFSSEEFSQSSLAPVKFPLECQVLPAVCCPLLSSSGFSLLDDWAQGWFP